MKIKQNEYIYFLNIYHDRLLLVKRQCDFKNDARHFSKLMDFNAAGRKPWLVFSRLLRAASPHQLITVGYGYLFLS